MTRGSDSKRKSGSPCGLPDFFPLKQIFQKLFACVGFKYFFSQLNGCFPAKVVLTGVYKKISLNKNLQVDTVNAFVGVVVCNKEHYPVNYILLKIKFFHHFFSLLGAKLFLNFPVVAIIQFLALFNSNVVGE